MTNKGAVQKVSTPPDLVCDKADMLQEGLLARSWRSYVEHRKARHGERLKCETCGVDLPDYSLACKNCRTPFVREFCGESLSAQVLNLALWMKKPGSPPVCEEPEPETVKLSIASCMMTEIAASNKEMRDEHAEHEKDVARATRYNALKQAGVPTGGCAVCNADLPPFTLACEKCGAKCIITMDGETVTQDELDMAKWLAEKPPEPVIEPLPDAWREIPFDEEPVEEEDGRAVPLSVLFSLCDLQTEAITRLAQHGLDIMEAKTHDYAADDDRFSNFEMVGVVLDAAVAAGVPGVYLDIIALLMTKIARLTELLGKKGAVNEPVEDTCVDLSNYALILGALHETR